VSYVNQESNKKTSKYVSGFIKCNKNAYKQFKTMITSEEQDKCVKSIHILSQIHPLFAMSSDIRPYARGIRGLLKKHCQEYMINDAKLLEEETTRCSRSARISNPDDLFSYIVLKSAYPLEKKNGEHYYKNINKELLSPHYSLKRTIRIESCSVEFPRTGSQMNISTRDIADFLDSIHDKSGRIVIPDPIPETYEEYMNKHGLLPQKLSGNCNSYLDAGQIYNGSHYNISFNYMSCLSVYPRKMITLIFNREDVEFLDIHQLRRLIIKRKSNISDSQCDKLKQLNSDVSKELQNLRPSAITHSALEFRERMNIKYAQAIYKASGCSGR
jgi:hypothetical protein